MKKQFNRMIYIAGMLSKYSHCWGGNPSNRMYSWVDEYNDTKNAMQESGYWLEYCKMNGFDSTHDAYDCMA